MLENQLAENQCFLRTQGKIDVPAMIRIEDEHWVFERVEEGVLKNLTHRLIIHDSAGAKTIGATENMETAMQVAQKRKKRRMDETSEANAENDQV